MKGQAVLPSETVTRAISHLSQRSSVVSVLTDFKSCSQCPEPSSSTSGTCRAMNRPTPDRYKPLAQESLLRPKTLNLRHSVPLSFGTCGIPPCQMPKDSCPSKTRGLGELTPLLGPARGLVQQVFLGILSFC